MTWGLIPQAVENRAITVAASSFVPPGYAWQY